ncbi:O-methyltransferase [Halobacillus mangrovi]|uniref:tRNA 5-hydroxyuridine methyltransferase n=1 Tax=Halobacillus mangrovi TaxID=402384 RepID=A0A1W5ZUM4_9BACI|nr:O-methyltransferase [Halobacillus mangrovi]ARI76979.1 SAM-dependent methyltransferase [Halobacillus mangrovi]
MKQEDYLHSLRSKPSEQIERIEAYAKENGVPIMEPSGIEFLMQLIRLHQPSHILEIGTAIGYSAIRMLEASAKSAIVTIERDPTRYSEAVSNLRQLGVENSIQILHGDALELEKEVAEKGPYDLLFIDAAKGKYEEFFHMYSPMLTERGVIISDNVLFKGYVADDELASPRMAKIAGKIRKFNEWLVNHPDYYTTIVPVGDGVAISVKK